MNINDYKQIERMLLIVMDLNEEINEFTNNISDLGSPEQVKFFTKEFKKVKFKVENINHCLKNNVYELEIDNLSQRF